MNTQFLDTISSVGILPVIKIEKLEYAIPLANALRTGGINAIEVTARSEVAFEAISTIKKEFPDMLVGAGTIHNPNAAQQAINAGAEFIVSPGYSIPTVEYCIKNNVPVIPGCSSPSDFELALEAGLKVVKFYPAEISGGVEVIKNYSGAYQDLKFLPTGGISFSNLADYLKLDCVAAVGGSFMASADTIRNEDWDKISNNCRKAIALSLGFELAHVGLNHDSAEGAVANAEALDKIFALGVKNGTSSLFCGKAVEFMKIPYYGKNGHIGFYTNSPARAKVWFERNGFHIREESLKEEGGRLIFFYLEEEVGGFALHVVKR